VTPHFDSTVHLCSSKMAIESVVVYLYAVGSELHNELKEQVCHHMLTFIIQLIHSELTYAA